MLTKKDIAELKAYAKPPGLVEMTLQGAFCSTLSCCCSVRPGKQSARC